MLVGLLERVLVVDGIGGVDIGGAMPGEKRSESPRRLDAWRNVRILVGHLLGKPRVPDEHCQHS
jgi:hypothetical protein